MYFINRAYGICLPEQNMDKAEPVEFAPLQTWTRQYQETTFFAIVIVTTNFQALHNFGLPWV